MTIKRMEKLFEKRYNKFEKKFNKYLSRQINSLNHDELVFVLTGESAYYYEKFCGYHLNNQLEDHAIMLDLLKRWGENYGFDVYIKYKDYNRSCDDATITILHKITLVKKSESTD